MLFWSVSGLLILVSVLAVLLPVLRGRARAARRSSYDMQIYRDQLKEIESERDRGLLSETEAAATRIEVSRRLLQAADAETEEAAVDEAPRRVSLVAGVLVGIAVATGTISFYIANGAPGFEDLPLAKRERQLAEAHANRPGQEEAEEAMANIRAGSQTSQPTPSAEDIALVDRLREVLEERPDDVRGYRLLANSLAALGRFDEARVAQQKVIALLGNEATPSDEFELAEMMILAAGGYVSPEAEQALTRGLSAAPQHPLGRYYSGVALLQAGRPDLTYPLWVRLLEESSPDAPWVEPIRAQIGEVARLAGLPPPPLGGPSAVDIEAAEGMSSDERQAMIAGMVESLGTRLAEEGGPPSDWAQLIRSLAILGETDRANAIRNEAQAKFADDPNALAQIESAARAGGLIQ